MSILRKFPFIIWTIGILLLMSLSLGLVWAKPKCDSPPCKDDGGGFETRDLPANALFSDDDAYAIQSDSMDESASRLYVDGQERVSCAIGRREGQFSLSTSNRTAAVRQLCLYGLDQFDNPPSECGDFNGCRLAKMITARGQEDLRFLQTGADIQLSFRFLDDRQNFWHVRYTSVHVEPIFFDGENPTGWHFYTEDCEGCASAEVTRIADNQWAYPIDCGGSFLLPFDLEVNLQ